MKLRFLLQINRTISFILAVVLVLSMTDTGAYAGCLDVQNNFSIESDISGEDYSLKPDLSETDSEVGDVSFSDVTNNDYEEIEVAGEVDLAALLEPLRDVIASRTRSAVIYSGDTYLLAEPYFDSDRVVPAPIGTTIYIEDVCLIGTTIWYWGYRYSNENELYGYIDENSIIYADDEWNSAVETFNKELEQLGIYRTNLFDAEDNLDNFPESYKNLLSKLKKDHPNWRFVPEYVNMDFSSVVDAQVGESSYIQATDFNAKRGFVGASKGSGWYLATKAGVEYYLDPRNFLNEEEIFMFEVLTYDGSYQTEKLVAGWLKNTFMSGDIPNENMSYAHAFSVIGKKRGISPVHLSSFVIQEQGRGGSALISGTYPGYEGYYNYFNVGASGTGATAIINGLSYAKKAGWNTRYKSLSEGALTVGNGYVLKGQDTLYYEKFNVSPSRAIDGFWHQYMQNIQAPSTQGISTYSIYNQGGCLDSAFIFKIPIYTNMPEALSISISAPVTTIRTADSVVTDTKGLTSKDKKSNVSSVQLSVKFTPECNLKKDSVKYSSSDKSVATVNSNGVVSAVGPGTATITVAAKDNGKGDTHSNTIKIKVIKPITDISSTETFFTLRRPDTLLEDDLILPEEDREFNISTKSLSIDIYPEDTVDKKTLNYSSSNKSVVKVSSDGKLTAVGKGNATITVKASEASTEYKPSIEIAVQVIAPVIGVTLTNPTGESVLLQGSSTRLLASITPKDATGDKEIHWESSDESVLTVDGNGNIAAIGEGTAVITAHSYVYSDSISFNVVSPRIKFYDVSGIEVLKEATVEYGEPIEEALFDEADAMYRAASGQSTIYLGMYTLPEGGGAAWSRTSKISEAVTGVYPLYRKMDSEFYVIPPGDYEYTGSTIKPVVHVYANVPVEGGYESRELTLNTDYKVAYANNTKVNTNPKKQPVVTVTGKGNYLGTVKTYFNIVPAGLDLASTTAADVTAQYTGKTIKSQPAVYRNGKKLVKDKDYKLSYPSTLQGAYRDAGSWPVLITGIGAYSGKISCNEIITKDILLSKVKITNIRNQSFINDPDGIETTFTIKYGKTELERGVHYTAEYINNHAIGTAQIVLTAIPGSGFRGTRTISFKITGTSIAKVKILDSDGKNGIKSKVYTGNEEDVKQSDYELWLGQDYLIQSTDGVTGDYVVKYTNINKAGTAKITFTGINYYTGSVTKTYKISPRKLAEAWTAPGGISGNELLPETPSHVFVKGGVKPVPEVKDGEKTLVKGTDYTITWANYGTVVTSKTQVKKLPYFIIKGKGSYTGSVKGYYRITDGCLGDEAKVSIKASDMVYSKKAGGVLASPVLKDSDGKTLVKNKDYKITSYTYLEDVSVNDKKGNEILRHSGEPVNRTTDIIPAGTHLRVTVTGMGNYLGTGDTTRETDYRVSVANLSKVTVKVLNKKYYDFGRPVKLTGRDLKVTYGGTELTEGVDYYIDDTTYSKNVNVGKATVTLRPVGDNINFCGSKSVSYTIQKRVISFLSRLKRE